MTSRTHFLFPSWWLATAAVLLALLLTSSGRSLDATSRRAVLAAQAQQDTSRKPLADPAQDEAWRRHEQANRAWQSRVAGWERAIPGIG